jgi:16S rRNA (adenine1518-N6/adenine1519-N6)-dimethyltransferase
MAAPYTPKKSLGQHFLHDRNIARNIVAALDPREDDAVLEIGPGPGALTSLLLERGVRLIACDIDARSLDTLRAALGDPGDAIRYIHADILEVDLTALSLEAGMPLRVIGNLPYNITSQIFFHLFEHQHAYSDAVFMIQKEVADRIVASPGGKEYGILSVLTQAHAHVRHCFKVSPNVFTPRPKIWSSVIHLSPRSDILSEILDYGVFRRVVKSTFGMRRKTLSNSLRHGGFNTEAIGGSAAGFLQRRPEQLSVQEFVTLSNVLAGHG